MSTNTLGLFARSVADLEMLDAALAESTVPHEARPPASVRIGLCRTPFWMEAETEMRNAVETTAQALRESGMVVDDVDLPGEVVELDNGFNVIQAVETAWALAHEYRERRNELSSDLRTFMDWVPIGCQSASNWSAAAAAIAACWRSGVAWKEQYRGSKV